MSTTLFTAKKAAKAGADVILKFFNKEVCVQRKNNESYNLVSEADLETEKAIVAAIKRDYPNHAFLGEEIHRSQTTEEHLWIIDPIDGTNNFLHGIPQFAVSIAYCHRGVLTSAVVFNPISGEMFSADLNSGAFVNNLPIETSSASSLEEALVGIGFYYDRGAILDQTLSSIKNLFHGNIHGVRRMGAASLDLCYVACGRYDAYFELQLEPWDFAAGALILREAGGNITRCDGSELTLEKGSVCSSNTHLHQQILSILSMPICS